MLKGFDGTVPTCETMCIGGRKDGLHAGAGPQVTASVLGDDCWGFLTVCIFPSPGVHGAYMYIS